MNKKERCAFLEIQCPLHAYTRECGAGVGDYRRGYVHGEVGGDVKMGEGCVNVGIYYGKQIYPHHRYDAEVAVATAERNALSCALRWRSAVL